MEEILNLIKIFWFFLPAGIANMSPVLFKWINFLNYPVDFNKKINNKPIFGKNKTYRGLFSGIIISIITVYIQAVFYQFTKAFSLIDYSAVNLFLLGSLLGFGALGGDLLKSFFKRQINMPPGKSWIPFDQIDWIIGAIILTSFYILLSLENILTAIILFGLLHPVINYIGYIIKIKKSRF